MEMELLHDYFGACMVKSIIFTWRGACEVRSNPPQVRLK